MSILVNTHNEQEEKILLAFLDSLKFEYKTAIYDTDEELQEELESQHIINGDWAIKQYLPYNSL